MLDGFKVDPTDAIPIWRQIEDGVRRIVASGALAANAGVPSVRDLARALRVNPATVAKAYQRLSDAGILAVRRGEGTFVASNPPAMSIEERERVLDESAARYTSVARTIGASEREAVHRVERAWKEIVRNRADGGQR